MKTKALVTGGCGFIGSHLVDILVQRNFDCMVADILWHGNNDSLAHLGANVRISRTDISDREATSALFESFRPDHVFHLAAHHFIPFCNERPLEAIVTNIEGTQNIADCCAQFHAKRLFFASTAAVYGISDLPHREEEVPNPTDIYGVTKAAGEKIVSFLASRSDVLVRIGRYFNAVGSRETNPHVVPEIISQLRRTSLPPTLRLGNLEPKRDFIHAADLADASLHILNAPKEDRLDIANIGTGQSYSVKEVVDLFSEALGYQITIETDPHRQRKSERAHLCADTGKLMSVYGWLPRYTLKGTIQELVGRGFPLSRPEPSTR